MSSYRVAVRDGAKVERAKVDSLPEALDLVERRARQLSEAANARPVDTKLGRRFEPIQQVIGRVELSGPGGCGQVWMCAATDRLRASRAASGAG